MARNDQLIRAVQVATRKLASSGNFDALMLDVLAICVDAVGATGGTIYLHDPAMHRLRFQHVLPSDVREKLPVHDIPDSFGMAGEAFQTQKTVCKEFPVKPQEEWNSFEKATGIAVRSMVATPLMMEDETPIGVVQLLNKTSGAFNNTDCAVLDTIAAVATMAYHNFRLSEESARASTLLGMGKVSHDIGNLAASLYSTLSVGDMALHAIRDRLSKEIADPTLRMYVDTINPTFEDLKLSIDRIVGYSRLISDMSAGRALRPNMAVGSLASAIESSAAYLASEARASHVELIFDVQEDAPPTLHDELYLFRIVQNLVGNAIKAVRETIPDGWVASLDEDDDYSVHGSVLVGYHFGNSCHVIRVRDTGPGMTRETAERILSGNARSQWDKASGSGWGLKIVMELAKSHGACVEIDSELTKGTTFTVTLPHHDQTPA